MAVSRATILGVPFDAVSPDGAIERTHAALRADKLFHVVTPGPEFIMATQQHPAFGDVLRRADLSLPDGMGIMIAGKLLKQVGLQRIPGMEYLDRLLDACANDGMSIFMYGAMPGIADEAAYRLMQRHPSLRIVGVESGFRGWLRVPESYIAWRIRRSGAALLLVALGAPEQELWIDRNRTHLGPVRVAIGVGGAFDFWSKRIKRAPLIFRKLGLEWSWRLLQEPQKRWRRIMTATWSFTMLVLTEKWRSHV